MRPVMHEGRLVSGVWYRRYVLKKLPWRLKKRDKLVQWTQVLLPVIIHDPHDKAEVRTINLHSWREREWLEWLTNNYSLCQTERPTVFPNHP